MWCDEAERSSGFQSEGLVVITLVTLRKKNGLWPAIVGIIQPPLVNTEIYLYAELVGLPPNIIKC